MKYKMYYLFFIIILFPLLASCSHKSEPSEDELIIELSHIHISPMSISKNSSINEFIEKSDEKLRINLLGYPEVYMDHNYQIGKEQVVIKSSQIIEDDYQTVWFQDLLNTAYIWITDTDVLDLNEDYDDIDLDFELQSLYKELDITSIKKLEMLYEIIYKIAQNYNDMYSENGSSIPQAFFKGEKLNGKGFIELTRLLLIKADIYSTIESVWDKSHHIKSGLVIGGYFNDIENILKEPEKMNAYLFLTYQEFIKLGYSIGQTGIYSNLIRLDGKYYSSIMYYNQKDSYFDISSYAINYLKQNVLENIANNENNVK